MSMDRSVEREKGSAPGPKSDDIVSPIKDFHVTLNGRRDLSGQIYRQLRAAIVDGRLCVGDGLPKTREPARRLDVARNTVAYDRLASEGFGLFPYETWRRLMACEM